MSEIFTQKRIFGKFRTEKVNINKKQKVVLFILQNQNEIIPIWNIKLNIEKFSNTFF